MIQHQSSGPNADLKGRLVSVIMPVRNEASCISHVLGQILNQDWPADQIEVIVTDGRSTDRTREHIRAVQAQHINVRLVDNPECITSTGLNRAIRAAKGEIIIRMDAHTKYSPDYVRNCVQALDESGADNVGGPWVAEGERYLSKAIAAAFGSPFSAGGACSHNALHEGPVDSVYLGCWRKSAFERFGYFDEQLVRNQDDEHNLRIIRGGGRVWQSPQIKSWYKPRDTFRDLFRQYEQYGYWKVRVVHKHKLPASWRHLVPAIFLLTLVLLALASVVHFPVANPQFDPSWLLAGLLLAYGVALLIASASAAHKTDWRLLPVLPAVFACYHIGYGYGFLYGIWDFVVRRGKQNIRFETLTR